MSRARAFAPLILLALVPALLFSCSLRSTPESTVQQFYKYLNDAEYSKAKDLYTTEARQAAEGPAMTLFGGYRQWAERETRYGSIDSVKIISSSKRGEGAEIDYRVLYKDGRAVRKTVPLTYEHGGWKIGLIPLQGAEEEPNGDSDDE